MTSINFNARLQVCVNEPTRSSNFLTFNWIWGLLIQSSNQTDFRLDIMSNFVIKLGLITLCLMCLNTFESVHSSY